jgi:GTP-binding protein YchF
MLTLLTSKPLMYVANLNENELATGNEYLTKLKEFASSKGAPVIPICAKLEAELLDFSDADKMEMMSSLGAKDTGLGQVIRQGYDLLNLLTFFTVGPKETRGWTVKKGATAPQAAGAIHSDFERGFIKADTIAYSDFISCSGESGARDQGKLRSEGKEYIVQEGDVFHFKFNV